MRILISGASISGPVLAYWLTRHGFDVTVVERAPKLRKTGGHAVDLFRPAMEISEKMGVLPRIEALATGTDTLTMYREGTARPVHVDLTKVVGAASDRHVEIMRDDLSEAYYDAGRDDVEYLFGDSITAISPDGEVTFEHAPPRRFDVVVGADGLHSNVRRLVFGEDAGRTRFLGGYLAVQSVPKALAREGEMVVHLGAGLPRGDLHRGASGRRTGAVHVPQQGRTAVPPPRCVAAEGITARSVRGDGSERWTAGSTNSTTRRRSTSTASPSCSWTPGRGDGSRWSAMPGTARGPRSAAAPASRCSARTSLRANWRRRTGITPARSRPTSGRWPIPYVAAARSPAPWPKGSFPARRAGVWALTLGAQLISALPTGLTKAVARLNTKGVRLYDSMQYKDYSTPVAG